MSRKLHPVSRGRFVLLNKLESGFLLLQTQQGLVSVEPSSFWQRVYLLWTFRNFRQLSPPLLNARQTALINNLFRQHAAVVSHEYESSLEIGLVEDFVPPEIDTGATAAAKTDASPAVKAKLLEQSAGQYAAPWVAPIAAAPAMKADVAPAVKMEEAEMEGAVIDRAEIAPKNALDRAFAPIISWSRPASSNRATSKPAASRPEVSRMVIFGFAAAFGALSLCVGFAVAFHRIGATPGSQAHSSLPQLNSPDSPSAPGPTDSPSAPGATTVAENPAAADNPATVPEVTPQAGDSPDAADEAASAEVASSITTTHRAMTPERASREAIARVAPRSSGGSHAEAFSRLPTSTSTRRMTLAPGSRGAMARSARSYFDLADQQMHKGNYAAAAANYKRAWRIEENSATAKGRLVRARRAMQAENESIANRR